MFKEEEHADGVLWMLHRVAPDRKETVFQRFDRNNRISPELLEAFITEAKEKGCRFVSLEEFLRNKKAGKGSSKDIVITIDDGYRDIYEYAWPVFEKYQVPFVFYVASDFIERGFDTCRRPEAEGGQLAMDIIFHNENIIMGGKFYPASTLAEKGKCFDDLWKKFKRIKRFHPLMSGRKLLKKLLKGYEMDFEDYKKKYICSSEDLREMASSPLCTIGAHGASHQPLAKVWLPWVLKREILGSKKVLEDIIGKEVSHFSYPYGSISPQAAKLVRRYYKSAAAVVSADGKTDVCCAGDDDYALPRIYVQRDKNPLLQVNARD